MSARTLKPPARALRSIRIGGDDVVLPRHRLRERDASEEGEEVDFELLEVLGRGGMGAVHLARQHALARSVAIKRLLPESVSSAGARQALLREAFVTGRLEHPNIVPVYSLGVDEQGAPIMVMKRIEGVSWQQALERPELLPRAWRGSSEREHEALLLGHVEIFEQVCLAIHYAHSRGVVHRDLKPENVMLGEHGEVYVVDWGIAVSVDPEEQGFLPLASQERHVVGTPMYMAPEQAAGEGLRISSLTDVYGLGAILHQVITGRMRHEGASLQAVLFRAYASEPYEYAEGIDEELAAICNRACEREPQARFESAAALREALSAWTKRRRGRELLEATLERLNAFKRLVDLAVASGQATPQQMTRAHALSGACRFGLERAGELLGQDARLESARQELLEKMLALEVLHGNLPAARALAEELGPKLSPAGASKLNDLSASLEAEQERIARLEQAVDFRIGRRGRGLFALALGAIWTVSALLMDQAVGEAETLDGLYARATLYKLLISVMSLAVWAWARGAIQMTAINRGLLDMLPLVLAFGLVSRLFGWAMSLDLYVARALEMSLYAAIAATMGVLVDRWLVVPGVIYVAGAFMVLREPSETSIFFALCNISALALISWRWFSGRGGLVQSREASEAITHDRAEEIRSTDDGI